MGLRPVLETLPGGHELLRGRRGVLAVERTRSEELARAGFGADGGEELAASDLVGRAPLETIEARGERWIVRRYHHGGMLRALGERCFLTPARPFQELVLSTRLSAAGIRTPRVVAARALRSRPFGWRLALVTARVEGAVDVSEMLVRLRDGELDSEKRAALLRRVGELVGALHSARFLHADLTAANVLVDPELTTTWILDLDRGRLLPRLSDTERRDNLRRLYRFVRRREADARPVLFRGDYLRFLRAYEAARGVRGGWRDDWRAIVRRDRRRALWHRLGWRLERLLGLRPRKPL